ncbi:MAG: transcription repressor NadR [Firmicutes bacterium]|nr:transcription repressor NadR [Bacillota bacterium]
MQRGKRQERLLDELRVASGAITGAELAERCSVTRQVVVHDIALLRASGTPILSTPQGYRLEMKATEKIREVVAVSHPPALTGSELYTFVDYGIQVLDVIVAHPVYGEITGGLHLSSRRDVDLFLQQLEASHASLLSSLTDGYHLHSVQCNDLLQLREAEAKLQERGITVYPRT